MKRIIIAIMLTCLVTPALDANAQGDLIVLGAGGNSCGKWTKKRKDNTWHSSGQWILGFVTAYNYYTPGVSDVAKNADNQGLAAWVDNYCAANPLNDIADASISLIRFLKAR